MLQTSLLLMKSLNKTETSFQFLICSVFFVFKGNIFFSLFYYTAAGVKAVYQYFDILQLVFHFLWDHWAHCGIFENGIMFMYTLEAVISVANFISAVWRR